MEKLAPRALAKNLGRNIAARRKAAGLTQGRLAELLDVDTLTVSRYETGNILPPLTTVETISLLLNTTMMELIGDRTVAPVPQADRIGIWLSTLSQADREWITGIVKQLVAHCQPSPLGKPGKAAG